MDRRKVIMIVAIVVALMGSGLLFLYVRGADSRASEKFSAVKVLVATAPIRAGETVEQATAKMGTSDVTSNSVVPGAVASVTDLDKKAVAVTDIAPGEQILSTKFGTTATGANLGVDKGNIAVSVNLTDPARVAGFVKPGDMVVVFHSATGEGGADTGFTRILLKEAKVVAVGSSTVVSTTKTTEEGAQTTEEVPKALLTLSLSDRDAQRLVWASNHGDLAFGLRTESSKVTDLPPTSGINAYKN